MENIATELEYLRYFFDQVNITPEEHMAIAEAFEMFSGKKVPKDLIRSTNPQLHSDDEDENIFIPKAPLVPSLGDFALDKGDSGEYVLTHKQSGEHLSLSVIIKQLKRMNSE